MSIKATHELHKRRFGRNLGVGLVLAGFVAIVFGLTIAKVTSGDFTMRPANLAGQK
ncbi:hypothetical protein [Antarcticimicrobium luteum]|uniref:hypothetical protein n=1 Tax=Antarcticimicrobium luteum TaxID=2547397 RepID=UPI00140B4D02|nr:hypothetical protein [Antarcticimicrobium luteum]